MVIYGLSPSSGVERRLEVEPSGSGVSLGIYDHAADVERDRIVVKAEDLLAAIMDRRAGGSTIQGTTPVAGASKRLEVEVRRNEVQLTTRADCVGGWDVAVGLDDFQDALQGVAS